MVGVVYYTKLFIQHLRCIPQFVWAKQSVNKPFSLDFFSPTATRCCMFGQLILTRESFILCLCIPVKCAFHKIGLLALTHIWLLTNSSSPTSTDHSGVSTKVYCQSRMVLLHDSDRHDLLATIAATRSQRKQEKLAIFQAVFIDKRSRPVLQSQTTVKVMSCLHV